MWAVLVEAMSTVYKQCHQCKPCQPCKPCQQFTPCQQCKQCQQCQQFMARCYLHLWWYFLMQGNYTTWAKRGALHVKELMLKLWNCYVLSKRDDCQDFFILFHRPSWDHRSPFQAPVSPKGWQEIKQFCKKTTTDNQGELPLQFPSEFIFEEKKCFAAWSKGTYNQLQRICGPFPRLENDHMYIYLHCTMIWHCIDSPDDEKNEKWRNSVGVDSKWRRNDDGAQLQMWTGCVAKERCSPSSIKKAKSGCSRRFQHSQHP